MFESMLRPREKLRIRQGRADRGMACTCLCRDSGDPHGRWQTRS